MINVIKKVAHTNDLYYLSMKKKTFEKSSFIYIFFSLSWVEMVSRLFMVYSQNILDSFISPASVKIFKSHTLARLELELRGGSGGMSCLKC